VTLLLAIDPATRTGWAYGPAGSKRLETGAFLAKQRREETKVAASNIGFWLEEEMFQKRDLPEIVVAEAPMGLIAWYKICEKIGRFQNTESIVIQHESAGVIFHTCQRYKVRCEFVPRLDVLKTFTGHARHGGRELAKSAVVAQCQYEQYVPKGFDDEDICDGIATHVHGSLVFCKKALAELTLFNPVKQKEIYY
jgi:hypothetical protein